jgi:hypothetical protein
MSARTDKGGELYGDPSVWLAAAFRITFVRYHLGKLREELEAVVPTFDETTSLEDRRPWTVPLYHLARASASLQRLSDHLQEPLPRAGTKRRRKRRHKSKRPRRPAVTAGHEKSPRGAPSARILTTPPAPLDDPPPT